MTATAFTIGRKGIAEATPLAQGELLVRGYLTRFNELDREQDRFVRGSFTKAIGAFMRGAHRPFVYHHSFKSVLGTVTELVEDAIGVRLTAKVNHQPRSSPLRWAYEALKNGTIRGLSAGGRFLREFKSDGTADIVGVDLIECSATATPVLASTEFEVIEEGKALDLWGGGRARRIRAAQRQLDLLRLKAEAMSIGLAARA